MSDREKQIAWDIYEQIMREYPAGTGDTQRLKRRYLKDKLLSTIDASDRYLVGTYLSQFLKRNKKLGTATWSATMSGHFK